MLILTTVLPLPDPTTFIASSTEWTSPMLIYLMPLIIITVGVALVFFVFRFIVGLFHK